MSRIARNDNGSVALRVLGWTALVTVMLVILVPVAALTFALQVEGHSMDPTLSEDNRLLLDPRTDHIERFDLVEATLSGHRIVKRVVGLPGDDVRVVAVSDTEIKVLVRPAGTDQVHRVDNEAWVGQVAGKARPCCTKDGETSGEARWATVPDDNYWLIGDNWGGSDDSRSFGFVSAELIGAELNVRILPLTDMGVIPNPARLVPSAT